MVKSSAPKGFTLIELLVTISILAILLALSWPSFEAAFRSNRVKTNANALVASFNLARTEAIRSNIGGGVCSSDNGTSCGGDWNDGWLVWSDSKLGEDPGVKDAADPVIRYVEGNPHLTLTNAAAVNVLAFDNRGRTTAGADVVLTLVPEDCPTGHELRRTFTISRVGQVRTRKGACE
jgi:type IV fimbrial biogenesis protein FimT